MSIFGNIKAHKLNLLVLVLVIVALGIGSSYLYKGVKQQYDIRRFVGVLSKVENNTITVNGFFNIPNKALPKELSSAREFKFAVNDTTQFHRITIQAPTFDEIKKAGGQMNYSLEDRPQKEITGSLADLAKYSVDDQIRVEVEFNSSIVKVQNPIAAVVTYKIVILPTFPSK